MALTFQDRNRERVIRNLIVADRLPALLCLPLLVVLSGCSASHTSVLAKDSVMRFRSRFQQEQYHEIYITSDKEFRQRVTEKDFIAFSKSMHEKLGEVKHSDLVTEQLNYTAAGMLVILS